MEYNKKPMAIIRTESGDIASFVDQDSNLDVRTVVSFGEEWQKFNRFSDQDIDSIGNDYFDIVDEAILHPGTVALDVGCGSGRWTKFLAEKVGMVEAIDPSKAVVPASRMLKDLKNVRVTQASVSAIPFEDESFDFVMSLGVLHHVPDTRKAVMDCVRKLKSGGTFMIYLYYSLDNRGLFFRTLFKMSDLIRRMVSSLPSGLKKFVCDILAVLLYLPFVWTARILSFLGVPEKTLDRIPLSYYRKTRFFIIRNDAFDRFGTPLEQRFSKEEIRKMLTDAGLIRIRFSENAPFWHAIALKPS